ncbi:MAG: NAD(P)/FAD-dependent oxidoreductase, partial [Thermoproteus sp.]
MVKIIGLGPSGAALGATLGRAMAVERVKRYYKACGEAVPVETPLVSREHVVDKVRRYRFFSGERLIGEISYAKPRWYIIDKEAWVESLRSAFKSDEEDDGVVVDARGPYSSAGIKVTVVMTYVEGIKGEDETADFIYPPGRAGFFWVFPHGDLYNVGGGFLGVGDPTPMVKEFVARLGGRIKALRGAPLTVMPEINLGVENAYRIGEAAGLVYPLTGEGIRPGVLSALALAEALRTKKPLEEYRRRMEPIVKQIEFQKRLLTLASRTVARGGAISVLADDDVLRSYIEENLSARVL